MDINEQKNIEKQTSNKYFEMFQGYVSKNAKTIQILKENAELDVDIPNVAVTLNNKVIELVHAYEKSGLTFFTVYSDKYDLVYSRFTSDALIRDLLKKAEEIILLLSDYTSNHIDITRKKNNQFEEYESLNPLKKLFLKIKSRFTGEKLVDLSLTTEEEQLLKSSLQKHSDMIDELFEYKLEDNIVPALVRRISAPSQSNQPMYSASVVPDLLQESVIPDLEKLGLSHLIPQLKTSLEQQYGQKLFDDPSNPTQKQAKETSYVDNPDR